MNITEFHSKKTALGVEGTGIDVTTTEQRDWRDKVTKEVTFTIPPGVRVHVDFMPQTNPGKIWITYNGEVKLSLTQFAYKWLTGFQKPPTIATLQKRSYNGISKSVTGKTVEPDGFGPDGSPSWELVIGII